MAGNFSDWSPYQNYVQAGLVDGAYANAGFTMIAAGPPRLANIGGAAATAAATTNNSPGGNQIVFPVGIVQNFNMSHTRNFSRIFEIGSERSYFIGGRTVGQIGLGRVYYHGSSLLRILYAYYQDIVPPTLISPMFANAGAASMSNPHDVVIPPGYENIYLNLASDLFAQPVGMLVYIRDVNQDTLGAIYFEACYMPNHSLSTDAQGVLIQEQVSVQFERAVPVQVAALTLVTNENSSNAGGANVHLPGVAQLDVDSLQPCGHAQSAGDLWSSGRSAALWAVGHLLLEGQLRVRLPGLRRDPGGQLRQHPGRGRRGPAGSLRRRLRGRQRPGAHDGLPEWRHPPRALLGGLCPCRLPDPDRGRDGADPRLHGCRYGACVATGLKGPPGRSHGLPA